MRYGASPESADMLGPAFELDAAHYPLKVERDISNLK
jgi:hypothetical protein